jgi:hypothetical protein
MAGGQSVCPQGRVIGNPRTRRKTEGVLLTRMPPQGLEPWRMAVVQP